MRSLFLYHCLRRDLTNFSLLRHRAFAGFMVSMHQSGTHWLKHMLASALTHKHGLPPPCYDHANEIIGGPREKRLHARLPRLASSHSIPHPLLGSSLVRGALKFPPYVVLVRDLRAVLVAGYEKWKAHYDCDFSTFLRGDVGGHRFDSDIWWCIRFYNAWGRLAARFPAATLVVKYESLRGDTLAGLEGINRFWALGLTQAELEHGIKASSKAKMAQKRDPNTPLGLTVVREDPRPAQEWFDSEDERFLEQTCRAWLKYDFGYGYRPADFS